MKSILISTSSFGVESAEPLDRLKKAGIEYVLNPHGRKLNKEELISLLKDKDGVVAGTEAYPKEVLEQLPSLRIISRCGAGTDGIDKDYLKHTGITLSNTPDVHVTAVAELTLAGLLSLTRRISFNHASMVNGGWEKTMGRNLSGKTVGIVGFGKVGQAFVKLISNFDCNVLVYDPYYTGQAAGIAKVNSLQEIWSQSEIISLHIPSSPDTKNLINKDVLEKVKPNLLLVNTSRGELIDEAALTEFLVKNPQAGAYLDVFQQEPYAGPLSKLPNVVVTPHIGTFTQETRVNMEVQAVMNLINFFEKQ